MKNKNIGWNIDNSYSKLPKIFYSMVKPNKVRSPELVILNTNLAKELGLDPNRLKDETSINILAGNDGLIGEELLAQAYAGHQFGHFTMLGDGRAMLVGEHITPLGDRVDIQLKGAGKTPYSRGGDGRAGLGPMLREYIISEAMNSLNIPTTRSLAVVTTGNKIYRETPLAGAILTRVAKSHIRVGTFQFASKWGELEDLKALANYTIDRHFPLIKDDENPYLSLLNEVIKLHASLIAKWQLVGFIHGVMNTDNMTISGETIDYGPCAFMDIYNPATVFSSIDRNGRYAYGNQQNIGGWNLARFGETLLPLIDKDSEVSIRLVEESLKNYSFLYNKNWLMGMKLKLGLINEDMEDENLINKLLDLMNKYESDFTNIFLALTDEKYKALDDSGLFKSKEFMDWNYMWISRLEKQDRSIELSKKDMQQYNPIIIPRNHQVEKSLELAVEENDFSLFFDFLKALSTPFGYENVKEEFINPAEKTDVPYKTYCGT